MNRFVIFVGGAAAAFIAIWIRAYFLLMRELAQPFDGANFESTCLSALIIEHKASVNSVDKSLSSLYHVTAFNRSLAISVSDEATTINKELTSQDQEIVKKTFSLMNRSNKLRANPEVAINIVYLQPYNNANSRDHVITKNLLHIIKQIGKTIPLTIRQFGRSFVMNSTTDSRLSPFQYYQRYAQQAESSIKRNCNTCQNDVFFVFMSDKVGDDLPLPDYQPEQSSYTYAAKGLMTILVNQNQLDINHSDAYSSTIVNHLRRHLFINPISHRLLAEDKQTQSSTLYETEIAAEVASRICYEYAWIMHWLQRMQTDVSGLELWRLWRLSTDQVDSLLPVFTKIRSASISFQVWNEGNEQLQKILTESISEQDRVTIKETLTTIHKVYTTFKPIQHEISLKIVESSQWQMLFVIFAPFWLPVSVPLIKLALSARRRNK